MARFYSTSILQKVQSHICIFEMLSLHKSMVEKSSSWSQYWYYTEVQFWQRTGPKYRVQLDIIAKYTIYRGHTQEPVELQKDYDSLTEGMIVPEAKGTG